MYTHGFRLTKQTTQPVNKVMSTEKKKIEKEKKLSLQICDGNREEKQCSFRFLPCYFFFGNRKIGKEKYISKIKSIVFYGY